MQILLKHNKQSERDREKEKKHNKDHEREKYVYGVPWSSFNI